MGYSVRPMNADDIPQVSEIDREAFPTEWPPPSFKRELSSSMVRYLVAVDESRRTVSNATVPKRSMWESLVAGVRHMLGRDDASTQVADVQDAQLIVGYASIWMMVDESHLTSIAVRQGHQHQGIGEMLLIAIINLSVQMKAQVVTLEVRASNRSAQALYAKYGFKSVGIRRRYYTDNSEDAVVMTTDKITSVAYQTKLRELEAKCMERHKAAVPASG
ncbi:MAG: ribosomal protein S18-alanine N-acetyltransferase [Dehalococcoidia bacterium]|nr:ribosomal protein S18-alanine N-acetyltransferase [Dehalococcoidia bacterium]